MEVWKKILEWDTREKIAGRKPTEITLSPWDAEELYKWADDNLHFSAKPRPLQRFEIFGLRVIDCRSV